MHTRLSISSSHVIKFISWTMLLLRVIHDKHHKNMKFLHYFSYNISDARKNENIYYNERYEHTNNCPIASFVGHQFAINAEREHSGATSALYRSLRWCIITVNFLWPWRKSIANRHFAISYQRKNAKKKRKRCKSQSPALPCRSREVHLHSMLT